MPDQTNSDHTPETAPAVVAAELAVEQEHLSLLYRHLDELRVQAAASLRQATNDPTTGTPAARSEREAFVGLYSARVSQLESVEARLCFGRLDTVDGVRRYIGRIGIADEERTELLVDWRAPAAEPFYQATAAQPRGIVRRRQLSTAARRVTGVQDEILDLAAFEADGVDGGHVVIGEGALFASLDASRSGHMRDIVATIQADQDKAIRAPLAGVFVVQGGPGTGKTAVALHRTAFLLYANRDRIARSGVLLVGPNRVFLRYIEQVLPALGESEAVLMSTPGELFPGVVTDRADEPEVASVKADLAMARVISEAVRRKQRLLHRPRQLVVEGTAITLEPDDVRHAREKARRSREKHNQARTTFVKELLRNLVRRLADARSVELDADTRAAYLGELYDAIDVRRELNLLWPPTSAEKLLRDLYADQNLLNEAGRSLSPRHRELLRRPRNAPWTISDVPLLDEAAELLGPDESRLYGDQTQALAAAERKAEVEYAEAVQETFGGQGFVSAEDLAERYQAATSLGSVADRSAADREWNFGHIVVDEAQELTAMMWRLLMRRSRSRSMTLVGDTAQTGALAGADTWDQMLRPHVGDRWNLATLTVNYRTPGRIMDVAARVIQAGGRAIDVPTSARPGEYEPRYTATGAPAAAAPELAKVVRETWDLVADGTVAIITSRRSHDAAVRTITAALGADVVTSDTASLGSPVSVLTTADAKGLEFDAVVLVEPGEIVRESARGVNDLYVALTRPTKVLHVVHAGELPEGLQPE